MHIGGTGRQPATNNRLRRTVLSAIIGTLMFGSVVAATQAANPRTTAVESLSQPKTAFQCESKFKTSQARARCFSELPGADCAHPLIAEKASETTRGEHQYFKLGYSVEPLAGGGLQHYSYRPASNNVAICPHGVVYFVSLLANETHCEGWHRRGHIEEYCSSEYDTKTIPEPSSPRGGSFTYDMSIEPPKSGYMVIKGYFIHPPWAGRE